MQLPNSSLRISKFEEKFSQSAATGGFITDHSDKKAISETEGLQEFQRVYSHNKEPNKAGTCATHKLCYWTLELHMVQFGEKIGCANNQSDSRILL